MSTETTIIVAAVVLWFAQSWYLNTRLERVHKKLDLLVESFDGLRTYLYEIDPQFDEERSLEADLHESVQAGSMSFSGMSHLDLLQRKENEGKRTLNTPFFELK